MNPNQIFFKKTKTLPTDKFFRQPDPQIGYLFNLFSMGTFLSFFMIIAVLIIFNVLQEKNES